ncbi:MAG: Hsp20/alpha crystallin family protein [Euryarchaeota archaeon]|nr:Hsp20/alpha crystallin family protein [Euryarchaeota archaeon]
MLAKKPHPTTTTTTLRTTPVRGLSNYMDQLFENFREEMMTGLLPRSTLFEGWPSGRWFPALLDVEDKGSTYEIRTDLPGARKDEIEVKVSGHSLQIQAQQTHELSEEGKNYLCHERTYGGFERTVDLPEDVVPEKISAQYKDGVLMVSVPKAHPVPERKIPVG